MHRSDPRLSDRITEDDLNERVKMSQRNLIGLDLNNTVIKDDEDQARLMQQDDQKTHTTAEGNAQD